MIPMLKLGLTISIHIEFDQLSALRPDLKAVNPFKLADINKPAIRLVLPHGTGGEALSMDDG